MFFKGKATFCPAIYWKVCGEVELRGDSTQPSSSEDVSTILFSNDNCQQQANHSCSSSESKAFSHTRGNIITGSNSSNSIRPASESTSASSLMRRKGDYHNSLVKTIKDRMLALSHCTSSVNRSSIAEKDIYKQQQQMARMGYLVQNSEGQRGVLVVCNLFEESLSNGCTELEVSWVTKRSQIQPGQILYAPKVKAYQQDVVDENSIQYFIVARYVKLVPHKSAIYQFFETNVASTDMLLEQSEVVVAQQERNPKKRSFTDASTQISHDKENVENEAMEQVPKQVTRKKANSTSVTSTFPKASHSLETASSASSTATLNTKNKKDQRRQRIKAIKKKIMKKVEEAHTKPKSFPPVVNSEITVKTERVDSIILNLDSSTPSFFNNGFISDIVVISDEEVEEETEPQSKPSLQSMTPLICSETPIMPSASTTITRAKRELMREEDEINLSSNSPITLSMLYCTANQVKEMCSILDKSPLLQDSQKEEYEAILNSENLLFTQEQSAPQTADEISSTTNSSSRGGSVVTPSTSHHNLELSNNEVTLQQASESCRNIEEKDLAALTELPANLNSSTIKEEEQHATTTNTSSPMIDN